MKSKNLAVNTIKKEETHELTKKLLFDFFSSDVGKSSLIDNLSNAFLSPGVLDQFMNASRDFVHNSLEDK